MVLTDGSQLPQRLWKNSYVGYFLEILSRIQGNRGLKVADIMLATDRDADGSFVVFLRSSRKVLVSLRLLSSNYGPLGFEFRASHGLY
jgi:hypothetical protein